ncbi:phenylalanine--tRNA ligase subunit beta [Methylonatrum kenyense]|uniref:phenylalanine--tRNA ligase subunit beta n=1 Tax=Methylonatrum kenyense TaxID=455253 RepID=UPI0020BE0D8A|nr:phenylalanine--tRNA ligase subunit beta [Methylonatrum kenyense]MCK8514950.1 phenylalanine--tRNA ligase subunit beta [Methylonatrum kenyense]
MRISALWLRELLSLEQPVEDIAHRLTMAGLEVDAIEPAAPVFSGVRVAEILRCAPHPDADRLQVCEVAAGEAEPVQIVCGAPNARPGLKAPLATVGGLLPGDFRIKKAKLRGVASFGMLSSARELGLSEDAAGLLELPANAPVGTDLREYLGLDDSVIDVDLTPNRGDCLSMHGVTRELAALLGQGLKLPSPTPVEPQHDATHGVGLQAAEACPRYVGRVIRGVNPRAETPIWLQERLRRAGLRSLGPVVDVTNYVMLELGQPMHAFDLARLQGDIQVRWARGGETLELLNGETAELDDDSLVIADDRGPLALAGVMGGAASAVADNTDDIFLESAFFAPTAIAGRARRYGLHTDSSHRFERGVDPALPVQAMERATELLLAIAGGEPGPVCGAEQADALPQPVSLTLRAERVHQLLGVEVPLAVMTAILRGLGMRLDGPEAGPWQVDVPSHRFDIALEVDLVEEIARVWGYDRIPSRRPALPLQMLPQPETRLSRRTIRRLLVDRGYQEAVTYSFVEPELQQRLDPGQTALPLANPLSADLSVMRTSLWPGLVAALRRNRNRQHNRVRLFEMGLRFRGRLEELEQTPMLAAVMTGSALPEQWGEKPREADFYDLKGDLEAVLDLGGNGAAFSLRAAAHPALHPGQSAEVLYQGRAVGWIGALHPGTAAELDLDGRVLLFELELAAVQQAALPAFQPLSRFPSIRRDLALTVPDAVPFAAVLACVRAAGGELLRDLTLFDVYQGPGLAAGRRSVGIGLIMQDLSRTLQDADVEAVVAAVTDALQRELDVHLRG